MAAKTVEVPGVGVVEFPDGMSDDAIGAAIQGMGTKPPVAGGQRRAPPDDVDPRTGQHLPWIARNVTVPLAGAVEGAGSLFGLADPAIAGAKTGLSYALPMHPFGSNDTVGDRYRHFMDEQRDQHTEFQERTPRSRFLGSLAPALVAPGAMAAAAPYSGALGAGAGVGARALAGVADASLLSGASTLAQHNDQAGAGQQAADAARSPLNLLGAVIPGAQGLATATSVARRDVGQAAGRVLKRVLGSAAQETPEAAALARQGVEGLTVGQRVPSGSVVDKLEQASSKAWFGMGPERQAALESWQRAGQDFGLPPGAPRPPLALSLRQRNKEIAQGFGKAYDKVLGGKVVSPEAVDELIRTAPETPGPTGTAVRESIRDQARKHIRDALTMVRKEDPNAKLEGLLDDAGIVDPNGRPISTPPEPTEPTSARFLQDVREQLRKWSRGPSAAKDSTLRDQYRYAEREVTKAINSTLTPEEQTALRSTDTQYAKWMIPFKAMRTGKGSFSPYDWERAAEKSVGEFKYRTDQGGPMQAFGEQGSQVFQESMPKTGFVSTLAGKKLAAPAARIINTPTVRSTLMGDALPPMANLGEPQPPAEEWQARVQNLIQALRGRK